MRQQTLLWCGLTSPLLYVTIDISAALIWHGYDYTPQAVSEFGAPGAPTRRYVLVPFILYDLLLMGFGAGIRAAAREKLGASGSLLIAVGILGLVATFFPMHLRGDAANHADAMHLALTALTVTCIVAAVGFGATAFGPWFRWWSIASIIAMLGFGLLAGLQAPRLAVGLATPGLGIFERINIGAWLLWVAIVSLLLFRARPRSQCR